MRKTGRDKAGNNWWKRVRGLVYQLDSEWAHDLTMEALGSLSHWPEALELISKWTHTQVRSTRLWDLEFPNPVGLAAGMDKSAKALPVWEALGFGFVELGGVTWHAQPGNPKPRMFRAVKEEALINRMGFNNTGAEAMAVALSEWKASGLWPSCPVGMNLGKSKITPLELAAEDYARSMETLSPFIDFFVVNVSSPNTPNLRKLQDKEALGVILEELNRRNALNRPILVKLAPDLSWDAVSEAVEMGASHQVAGWVAVNTTLARPESTYTKSRTVLSETGGLSGRPLRKRSLDFIRYLSQITEGKTPIIGVGGIFDAWDVLDTLEAGASLVQMYTGLVYEGPGVVASILRDLSQAQKEEN